MSDKRVAMLVLAICAALHMAARGGLAQPSDRALEEEAYLLPPPAIIEASALNYRAVAADMIWVRALVYFGELRDERRDAKFEHLDDYASGVVALDPSFYPIYNWLTATYMATRPRVSHQDILAINQFLDKGIQQFPTQSDLLRRAGLNAIGYSEGHSSQERIIELTEGIGYLERCMRLPDCPDNTAFVVSWMYNKRAQLQAEVARADREADVARERAFSLEVYPRLSDPELRARMRKQLLAMGVSEAELDVLERAQVGQVRLDYEARAPYLPLDLWALTVSPRP